MKRRIYFDSFGQVTPMEIQKYLKTTGEYDAEKAVIHRNTDTDIQIHMYAVIYVYMC